MKPLTISNVVRTLVIAALAAGAAGAVVRAAGTKKYWQQRQAMQAELRAAQEAEGLSGGANRKALYAKYPTPEITLCKPVLAQPGATVTLSVTGKFGEKTRFLVANDDVELGEGTVTAGKYSVSATSAPETMPSFARIHAIAAVSGANDSCSPLFIGSVTAYDLRTDNGWTIKLVPEAKAFTLSQTEATLPYTATFIRNSDDVEFKKMSTLMTIRANEEPGKDVYLSLQPASAAGSPDAEAAEIEKKLNDKAYIKKIVGTKEFERMMTRYSQLTEAKLKKMQEEQADPAYAQKAQQEQDNFGCSSITFSFVNGRVNGSASCGKNVGPSHGRLKISGAPASAAAE